MSVCSVLLRKHSRRMEEGGWVGWRRGVGGEGRKHFCLGCVLYLRVKLRLKEEPIINLQLSKKRKTNPHWEIHKWHSKTSASLDPFVKWKPGRGTAGPHQVGGPAGIVFIYTHHVCCSYYSFRHHWRLWISAAATSSCALLYSVDKTICLLVWLSSRHRQSGTTQWGTEKQTRVKRKKISTQKQ